MKNRFVFLALLIAAVGHSNEELQMPPDSKLPDSVIADFEKWIALGAADPRDGIARLPREIAAGPNPYSRYQRAYRGV